MKYSITEPHLYGAILRDLNNIVINMLHDPHAGVTFLLDRI